MKTRFRRQLLAGVAVLLILALIAGLGLAMRRIFMDIRQKETDNILYYYSQNITLRLKGSLNEADTLANTARVTQGDTAVFESAAASLLEREEVRYVGLFKGDTMVSALPESDFGNKVGRDLQDFSYIYTMAKVVKEVVVEGPVTLEGNNGKQEVFLFIQPFVEDDFYLGEVAVALDRDYVLEQLGLTYLTDKGYDYELWSVDPQNGNKEVIAVSQADVDFSHAAKTSFNLPTQWNLSVQPKDGWIGPFYSTGIVMISITAAVLLLGLLYSARKLYFQKQLLKEVAIKDRQTSLYNRAGFTEALNSWFEKDTTPIVLFYFVFEDYNQVSQLISPTEEHTFLHSIPERLGAFVENPFIAGRVGEANYLLAVREDMDESQQEDFAKGMSLELLLKTRVAGKKIFFTAHYKYLYCIPGTDKAENQIASLISSYYKHRSEEAPVRMLTEKCRQLIEGQSNVAFDEYTDLEMMELSKAFNQYRKHVEQLAYYDPVFNVGNRPKYLWDANMLISYDKKRNFSLFCIDICAFSQYNELFSADIGDQILHEVVNRLSRPFGTNLYRVNGDVFLGISQSSEDETVFAQRLQDLLTVPVTTGNASFALHVRIAVCQYPVNGSSPDILLERIQAALRYAKESNQNIVLYNNELDEIIRTEADILHRLKAAIQKETLEVWYQPLLHVETGRFAAAEALVRLPNGKGGYFSARQVVSLAERSGLVEQLGDYVLRQACAFMHTHGKALGLRHMGVNLSVQQLFLGNSAEYILNIIRSSGVNSGQITLEITESVLIQSIDNTTATLNKLRETGIRIALDDFGVGYSSLNYLSNLPVDVVKIDRSLIRQICANSKQYALLHSIVEMAKINSLTVVAEGVETEAEKKMVFPSGIQYIQGFYYARPMREKTLIQFLKDKNSTPPVAE